MKVTRTILTLIAAGGMLAFTPALFAQSATTTNAPGKGPRGPMSVDDQLAGIDTAVKLTAEQKPKVKALLEEQGKKMTEARALPQEERRAKMTAVREETTKKMKEILTAEQFTKYEAMPRGRGQGGQGGGSRTNRPAGGQNN